MKSQSKIPSECSEAVQCRSKVCPNSHSSVPDFTFGVVMPILTSVLKKMEIISLELRINIVPAA